MTLGDLTLPIAYADARQLALVFDDALRLRLAAIHRAVGSTNCVPAPVPLLDGRWLLSADVLTEVMPGGLLARLWDVADKAILLPGVTVIPWPDAVALLPPQRGYGET